MSRFDIVLVEQLEGGLAPFFHEEIQIRLHNIKDEDELPLFEGAVWAFVAFHESPDQGSAPSASEFCRRLRCHPRTAQSHITAVLDRGDRELEKRAKNVGVDDFMDGPLTRAKVLDRVLDQGMLYENGTDAPLLRHGDLTIDLVAYRVTWNGKLMLLSPNEFRLLRFFVEHPGRVFTRPQLIAALGKQAPALDERTVDVWIGRLRRALRQVGGPDYFRTVRSLGYILDKV